MREVIKGSDIPSLRSLLVVEERMSSSEYFQHSPVTEGHQKLYTSCASWNLLSLHSSSFSTISSCLRRTWWDGVKEDVWIGRVKGKAANPDVSVYVCNSAL